MDKKINLLEAISIGIGGMVGGGIFAVLGLAVTLAKGGTYIAFLLAGIIALMTSYSYAKLTKAYNSNGGTVEFINRAFGVGIFSGSINNLLWLSYIIMLSLYSSAFGSYAPNLLSISGNKLIDFHIYASLIIVIATIINYYSISLVGKVESYAVIIKLIILISFIIIGIYGLRTNPNIVQLSFKNFESPIKLFSGGMVIFVAYEGFELIANASTNITNRDRNIPLAYYISVIFVIILYLAIAIVTVGSLPFDSIVKAQDYALAEAAKPMLGSFGFTIITIAALISTFSAINASIYGGGQVNYDISKDKELPSYFMKNFIGQPIGLLITSIATLILVNTLKLESISTAGSIGFLLIFSIVNFVSFKLSKDIQSNKYISLLASIFCLISTIILIHQQLSSNIAGIIVSTMIILSCFILEYIYKTWRKNENN